MRLHAWRGDLADARHLVASVHDADLYTEAVNTRLPGDLAFWAHDWAKAVAFYDLFLSRWPGDAQGLRNRGLAKEELGDEDGAAEDYEAACAVAGDCGLIEAYRERPARFTLLLQPGYVYVPDRRDGYDLFGLFEARVVHTLNLGVSARVLGRDVGDRVGNDVFLQAHASWKADFGLLLYAAGGFTVPEVTFSPLWSVQIEPGWAFRVGAVGVEARLKYWYLQFGRGGAHVISPAAMVYWRSLWVSLRYWLTLDTRPAPGHAIIGKVGVTVFKRWHPYVGLGGGDRADYLDFRERESDRFWLLTAGLAYDPHWRHRIRFDWVYRNESSDDDAGGAVRVYQEHLFKLGYRLRF